VQTHKLERHMDDIRQHGFCQLCGRNGSGKTVVRGPVSWARQQISRTEREGSTPYSPYKTTHHTILVPVYAKTGPVSFWPATSVASGSTVTLASASLSPSVRTEYLTNPTWARQQYYPRPDCSRTSGVSKCNVPGPGSPGGRGRPGSNNTAPRAASPNKPDSIRARSGTARAASIDRHGNSGAHRAARAVANTHATETRAAPESRASHRTRRSSDARHSREPSQQQTPGISRRRSGSPDTIA